MFISLAFYLAKPLKGALGITFIGTSRKFLVPSLLGSKEKRNKRLINSTALLKKESGFSRTTYPYSKIYLFYTKQRI